MRFVIDDKNAGGTARPCGGVGLCFRARTRRSGGYLQPCQIQSQSQILPRSLATVLSVARTNASEVEHSLLRPRTNWMHKGQLRTHLPLKNRHVLIRKGYATDHLRRSEESYQSAVRILSRTSGPGSFPQKSIEVRFCFLQIKTWAKSKQCCIYDSSGLSQRCRMSEGLASQIESPVILKEGYSQMQRRGIPF